MDEETKLIEVIITLDVPVSFNADNKAHLNSLFEEAASSAGCYIMEFSTYKDIEE